MAALPRAARQGASDRAAKAALRETRARALVKGARAVLHAPRPIQSAPSLFRINGCGTGLYGERDRNDEGWYVATYFICLLFIPVFPLTAYRVRRAGDNAYQFAAKERLGPIPRAYQALVAGALAVSIAWSGVHSYLDSPARKARIAEEAAQAADTRGDRDGALTLYRDFLRDHGGHASVGPAALSVVRLASAAVPDPCTRASVEARWGGWRRPSRTCRRHSRAVAGEGHGGAPRALGGSDRRPCSRRRTPARR